MSRNFANSLISPLPRRRFLHLGLGALAAGGTGLVLSACENNDPFLFEEEEDPRYLVHLGPNGYEIQDQLNGHLLTDPAVMTHGLPLHEGASLGTAIGFAPFNELTSDLAINSMPEWNFRFFCVRLGDVEIHELGWCVPQRVKHIHLSIKPECRHSRGAWFNLHLGTYFQNGQRCFVLYESALRVCLKTCPPTFEGLRSMIRDGMGEAFRARRIDVPPVVMTAAAGVLAIALFGVMLALAPVGI